MENQSIGRNEAAFFNMEHELPIRVFILWPWELNNNKKLNKLEYKYVGLWRVEQHSAIKKFEEPLYYLTTLIPFVSLNYSEEMIRVLLSKAINNLKKK